MFRRVLVANRGEIAVRIIRALREMNITSVAVYSREDKNALHVRLADYRVCIGEGSARASYLNMNSIIAAALNYNCDAVHPGYGFLSENAEFAQMCADFGLTFIGPSPELIASLGSKTAARKLMMDAGIPVVPGSSTPFATAEEALPEARRIGFPVMIKAAEGGGGKGMRVCRDESSFTEAFTIAQQEAVNAFGSADLYLERLLEHCRHVEVQILADRQGNIRILGERDCSIQRNHQKVIEESPCPVLSEETRAAMYADARRAAEVSGYYSAGTIEFLVDPEQNHYFLEMNTRLQVEHGVTEITTGCDIVQEQIRIAADEPMRIAEDIRPRGHSIECRINAEMPEQNFTPSPGTITAMHLPGGNGVRVDTAVYTGYTVPAEYDSMIAKIIVCADDREAAIQRMRTALDETLILGIDTNLDYLYKILETDAFKEGRADTSFLQVFTQGGHL